MPVREFDSETARRGVLAFLGQCLDYPVLAVRHHDLVSNFFWRDLMGRFRGSFLGAGWTLVQPIFLFSVYFVVFGFLFSKPGSEASIQFAIWLFSGIVAFNALQEATTAGCRSVLENGNLVKKVAFPAELLLLSPTLAGLVMHLVGLVVAIPAAFLLGQAHLGPEILLLPVALALQFVMVLGIGLLLAAVNVVVRDTSHLYGVLSMAWFFLSPLFYTPSLIRDKVDEFAISQGATLADGWGDFAVLVATIVNPAHGLLLVHRQALGIGTPELLVTSLGFNLAVAAGWSVVFFAFGLAVFRSRKSRFSDLI